MVRTALISAVVLVLAAALAAGAAAPRFPRLRPPAATGESKPAPGAGQAPAGTPPAAGGAQWGLTGALGPGRSGSPYESGLPPAPATEIDKLVFGRLQRLGIQPANLCSDAVFVRRAFLDVIGTLPTADEAREFIESKDPKKHAALIDRLLAREEFADYWAMKWSAILRIKAEFPINLWPNAAQAYHRWIRASIRDNKPYDRFVREMLTESGSNFRVPPVNFYRAVQSREPQAVAQAVALAFMGTRADKWPKQQLDDMAAFFSCIAYKPTQEWKEEIVMFDAGKAAALAAAGGGRATLRLPDGTAVALAPDQDPREVFADWLISAKNPWFARNIVNRIWSWLLGRGIIHEPDDIRPDNPPSNPELLAYLERELAAARYDLKHIYRLILNSNVYRLSCIPRSNRPEAAANFASYPLRRLEAEVLIDAICQITGTSENYTSAIPEPFTFVPQTIRSIALPDGSITSSFLELFGRPPRDTGLESERNNRFTAAQRLHLLNSSHVQRKIEQSEKLRALMQSGARPRDAADALYLTILSRYPTDEELKVVAEYVVGSARESGGFSGGGLRAGGFSGGGFPGGGLFRGGFAGGFRRSPLTDVAWALVNSTEFLFRH